MRSVTIWVVGFTLGFAIVASSVAAVAFAVIGVGGHLLARHDPGYARVISFDPSSVASNAPYPAVLALVLAVIFALIARRLRPLRRPSGSFTARSMSRERPGAKASVAGKPMSSEPEA